MDSISPRPLLQEVISPIATRLGDPLEYRLMEGGSHPSPWSRNEAYTHRGKTKGPLVTHGHSGNDQKGGMTRLRQAEWLQWLKWEELDSDDCPFLHALKPPGALHSPHLGFHLQQTLF